MALTFVATHPGRGNVRAMAARPANELRRSSVWLHARVDRKLDVRNTKDLIEEPDAGDHLKWAIHNCLYFSIEGDGQGGHSQTKRKSRASTVEGMSTNTNTNEVRFGSPKLFKSVVIKLLILPTRFALFRDADGSAALPPGAEGASSRTRMRSACSKTNWVMIDSVRTSTGKSRQLRVSQIVEIHVLRVVVKT